LFFKNNNNNGKNKSKITFIFLCLFVSTMLNVVIMSTGWAKKTGPFLYVDNF